MVRQLNQAGLVYQNSISIRNDNLLLIVAFSKFKK